MRRNARVPSALTEEASTAGEIRGERRRSLESTEMVTVASEHTVLQLSFYSVALGQIRKSETANETAIGAFHSMVFLLRLLLLELAFASDRKDSVLDCHFYVFLFHVRQLGFNHVFLVIFGNVGERFPISNGDILSS